MGRPVNKKHFGATDAGAGKDDNISVMCKVGSNAVSVQGTIVSQRASNKFRVNDAGNAGGNEGVCTLVDKASAALGDNEMSIEASVGGVQKRIKKIFNRTCTDFANVRYTWSVADDSTANKMTLVAI
jgi:hypothetical protein